MQGATQNEEMCRVRVELTADQADALLHLLLSAPPSTVVSEEMTEALLHVLADAQRAMVRRRLQMEPGSGAGPFFTAH